MTSLSVCVVALNEQGFIGSCLASVRSVADEIIVVDTGSSDRTPEIAARLGAKVFHHPWPGDYAAGYDLPLAHASAEWILVLDADEALDPGSASELRRFLGEARADGYVVEMRNYWYSVVSNGRRADPSDPLSRGAWNYFCSPNVRLFRNRKEYRYIGRVHQNIVPSIRRSGGRIDRSTVVLHHWGPLRILRNRAKRPKYLELARGKVADSPTDAQSYYELGATCAENGEFPSAVKHYTRAHEMGFGTEASYRLGKALAECGRHEEAVPHLLESIRAYVPGLGFHPADVWDAMATFRRNQGKLGESEEACRRSLECRPEGVLPRINLSTLLCQRGSFGEARPIVEGLQKELPGWSEPWILRGAIRLQEGDPAGAREDFERALDIDPTSLPARANLSLLDPGDEESKPPDASGAVVSLIEILDGGAGRVLVEVCLGLRPRPQIVLCRDDGRYHRNGLAEELRAAGIPVEISPDPTRHLPSLVLHHWMDEPGPSRVGREPWIAVGHTALAMPEGYDAYVVFSEFQKGYQRAGAIRRIAPAVGGGESSVRKSRTLAVVASLDPGKFPRRFLSHLPDLRALGARVEIAGGGARRYEVERDVERLGLQDHIRFVGRMASGQVSKFLQRAELGLVLTETYEDAVPVALLEMLAAGLPVVAKPWGAVPEWIVSGENGFLADSEEEFAARIEECLRSPRQPRRPATDLEAMRAAFRGLVDEFSGSGSRGIH